MCSTGLMMFDVFDWFNVRLV